MTWKKFLLSSAILYLFLFDDNHVLARDSFHEGQTRGKKHFSKIIGGEQPKPGSSSANDVSSQAPTKFFCNVGTTFELIIKFDNSRNETSWNVVDVCDNNKEVTSGAGNDTDSESERVYYKDCLTTTKKYRFTIHDSSGDGFSSGGYSDVYYDDNAAVRVEGNFGNSAYLEFGDKCPKPTCSSVGNLSFLRKKFCKGRTNSSNSKFARHWQVKDGEEEDVLNTVCKFKECKKSDCCEKGRRKCTNTGNKGLVQGGFTDRMCGNNKKLKDVKKLKRSPCTGQDGFKCTKKDCCIAI